ncbi:unnamed protein product [Schistocephalus solidus]|uniref:OTU domain-containing protein n=2 Tax=Schistocephalus solidus TaxID=70667 RepID=A0A183TFM4_SCHSO|nr:unnamed protein product [Schistocephalus solidus]
MEEIQARHSKEKKDLQADNAPTAATANSVQATSEVLASAVGTTQPPRQSRAARRREKAAAEQRALAEAIAQSQSTYQASSSGIEFAQLAEVLDKRNLVLHKVTRIQNIKKGVPKGDRQKRAAAIAKIQQLEKALAARQEAEIAQCQGVTSSDTVTATGDLMAACSLSFADNAPTAATANSVQATSEVLASAVGTTQPPRQSRAARRREKAAAEQRALAEAIAQSQSTYQASSSGIEFAQLAEVLDKRNLVLHKVPSDGDCLFASVAHQMEQRGLSALLWDACKRFDVPCDTDSPLKHSLRRLAVAVIRQQPDEFLPFMCDTAATLDSEEKSSNDILETHLKNLAKPGTWGGHLELSALSLALQLPIEVIQVKGPPIIVGDFPDRSPLIITYHHHAFSLGEHYNSCKPSEKN